MTAVYSLAPKNNISSFTKKQRTSYVNIR